MYLKNHRNHSNNSPTHCAEWTSSKTLAGWIWQRHLYTMCDSCTPVLDCEMLSLRFAEAVKHENYNFNVFITLLGQDIDECLLMSHLGQSCSLKLKHKSN